MLSAKWRPFCFGFNVPTGNTGEPVQVYMKALHNRWYHLHELYFLNPDNMPQPQNIKGFIQNYVDPVSQQWWLI